MPTDFANDAAVVAAGYKKVQLDRGASVTPRYETTYSKPITAMRVRAAASQRPQESRTRVPLLRIPPPSQRSTAGVTPATASLPQAETSGRLERP
jgi:hypothetical protein